MEAACRGASEARLSPSDSIVLGVLPSADKHDANPWVDVALPTGIGLARNSIVALAADAVVAVGGGTGTLSEIAYAWQFGRPVFALTGTGGWADRLAGQCLDARRPDDEVVGVADPEELVERIAALIGP